MGWLVAIDVLLFVATAPLWIYAGWVAGLICLILAVLLLLLMLGMNDALSFWIIGDIISDIFT